MRFGDLLLLFGVFFCFLGGVPGKDSSSFTVCVHACPPPGFFKPSRFHPQRNNIRTEWYTGLQASHDGRDAIYLN